MVSANKTKEVMTQQPTQNVNLVINIRIQEFGRFTFVETLGGTEKSKEIEISVPYTFPRLTSPTYIVYSLE